MVQLRLILSWPTMGILLSASDVVFPYGLIESSSATHESVHDKFLALCFPVAIFEEALAKLELLFDSFADNING